MEERIFTLERSRRLTADVFELLLSGNASALTRPGQFVQVSVPGKFLRRPISVANWSEDGLLLLVRAVGEGSRALTAAEEGTRFSVLTGLGNGFTFDSCGDAPLLVGGGIGLAPLYGLARRMIGAGVTPTAVLGFRTAADVFYAEEFAALGCRVFLATEDGSLGTKGFVTECVARFLPSWTSLYACGPTAMLRAAAQLGGAGGQFSLEARMGCGFGACMGCTIETADGPRRVCADGPVFRKEALIW